MRICAEQFVRSHHDINRAVGYAFERGTEASPPGPCVCSIMEGAKNLSEVTALLGPAARVTESDGAILWHYEEKGQGALFVRFKVGGLFGSDKVDLYNGPDLRPLPKANAGARLREMALRAREGGNAALALVYAQSALSVEPGSEAIKELVGSLIAEISGQTRPR